MCVQRNILSTHIPFKSHKYVSSLLMWLCMLQEGCVMVNSHVADFTALINSFSTDHISLRPRSLQTQRGRVFEVAGFHNHLQISKMLHAHNPGLEVRGLQFVLAFAIMLIL